MPVCLFIGKKQDVHGYAKESRTHRRHPFSLEVTRSEARQFPESLLGLVGSSAVCKKRRRHTCRRDALKVNTSIYGLPPSLPMAWSLCFLQYDGDALHCVFSLSHTQSLFIYGQRSEGNVPVHFRPREKRPSKQQARHIVLSEANWPLWR